MIRLLTGQEPPAIVVPPPGPESRALCRQLAANEAPGINALGAADEPAIVWREALGANVLDVDGNRYVDLTSGFGVAAIGHRHPAVVDALARQAAALVHGLADVAAHPVRIELAARLAALAPVDDPRIYFAVSGSDAIEIALKTARLATGRPGIVAFDPAYHGLTLGALAATSRAAFRAPFRAALDPGIVRLAFGCPSAAIALALARRDVAAVVVEPIVGREGVLVPPAGWLSELARLCRAHGTLLVADEIFTGFGRTGFRFAVDAENVRPDLLCCGKALGGGLPLAAVVGRAAVMEAWRADGEARHTATFVAHPLACAAGLATLDVLEREDAVGRARRLGEDLGGFAARLAVSAGVVARGRGALLGIELVDRGAAAICVRRALATGVLVLAGGPDGRVVEIVPPLLISRPLLASALELLAEAIVSA